MTTDDAHPLPSQTQEVEKEAARLLQDITPGPWAWEWIAEKLNEWAVGQAFDKDGKPIEGRLPEGEWLEDTIIERRLVGMNETGHARAADAEFIAAAPRLVKVLLALLAAPVRQQHEIEAYAELIARTQEVLQVGRDDAIAFIYETGKRRLSVKYLQERTEAAVRRADVAEAQLAARESHWREDERDLLLALIGQRDNIQLNQAVLVRGRWISVSNAAQSLLQHLPLPTPPTQGGTEG